MFPFKLTVFLLVFAPSVHAVVILSFYLMNITSYIIQHVKMNNSVLPYKIYRTNEQNHTKDNNMTSIRFSPDMPDILNRSSPTFL